MLDLSHIPNSQQDMQIFNAISGSNSWQTWQKPRKCNYVWIMCIGGAGGGAGGQIGFSVAMNNPGGGPGAVTRALYNAQQLPDILYVQAGLGGTGGGPGSIGNPGTRSNVSLQPAVVAQNLVASSGNAGAVGGSIFRTTPGETAATQTTATFFTLSNFISTPGTTTAQPSTAAAPLTTPLTSQITCPGAAGAGQSSAGSTNNGGSIVSTSISPFISGGLAAINSTNNAQRGEDGITSWKPFYSLGGTGGGSSISGSGGNGGNGGIGSGGGGGGQSLSPGSGGKGGDGLVVIISF